MVARETMNKIREDLQGFIGEEVCIQLNAGRNKIVTKRGIVDSAYSNTFLIKDLEDMSNLSYSYADVIMNSLQITRVDSGEQIMQYSTVQPQKFLRA